MQLLLVQHRPHAGGLLRRLVRRRPRGGRPPGHRLCGGRGGRSPSAPPARPQQPPHPTPPQSPPPHRPPREGEAGTCQVGGGRWQRRAARTAGGGGGGGAVGGRPVVGAAEQVALPQAELVAGQELAAAGGAAETLQVVDVVAGAHHQVAAAEGRPALGALDAEEPAGRGGEATSRQGRRPRRRGGSGGRESARRLGKIRGGGREGFCAVSGFGYLGFGFGSWVFVLVLLFWFFLTSVGAFEVTCCNPACSRPCRRAGSMCRSRPGAARTRRT